MEILVCSKTVVLLFLVPPFCCLVQHFFPVLEKKNFELVFSSLQKIIYYGLGLFLWGTVETKNVSRYTNMPLQIHRCAGNFDFSLHWFLLNLQNSKQLTIRRDEKRSSNTFCECLTLIPCFALFSFLVSVVPR